MPNNQKCPDSYNDELKSEIIDKSLSIQKKLASYKGQAVIDSCAGLILCPFVLFTAIKGPWFMFLGLVAIALAHFTYVYKEYQNGVKLGKEDHTELHEMAEKFSDEQAERKEQCLDLLREEHRSGLMSS